MGTPAVLRINIVGDASKASREMDKASASAQTMGQRVKGAGAAMAGAFAGAAIIGGVVSAVRAASDLQQSLGAVESVFKSSAGQVQAWGREAASAVGLAQSQYQQLAAVVGAQLQGMGVAIGESATKSNDLIKVGADLAATFGGTTADAVAAISSLLRGERDPIEKYGIAIKQVDVNAKLAAAGMDKLTGPARQQAEAQATLQLLMEKSAAATGAFARESDTAAGAQQRMTAHFDNAKATLGTALLPILTQVATVLATVAQWLQQNSAIVLTVAGVIGTLVVAYKIWTAVQWLLNVAMTANPIGLVIVAIAALIAGIVIAYKRSETFRTIVDGAFRAVGTIVLAVVNAIMAYWRNLYNVLSTVVGLIVSRVSTAWNTVRSVTQAVFGALQSAIVNPFNAARDAIQGVIDKIREVVDWIRNRLPSVPSWLQRILPGGFAAPALAASAVLAAAGAAGPVPAGRVSASALAPTIAAVVVPNVRVYIGQTELTDLVRVVVDTEQTTLTRRLQARRLR